MTEYEAYDTVLSLSSETYSLLFGYFSLVFAFLVMSYMAAKKLPDSLALVVIGLYTLATAVIVLSFYALNADLDNLYAYILERKMEGDYDLSWFGSNPVWIPQTLTGLQVLVGLGGYFGSIYFFFHNKR